MKSDWTPGSWRTKEIFQQPKWPKEKLDEVCSRLSKLPPLVFAGEIDSLKSQLAAASRGEAFLLQGGDCAEDFSSCNAPYIRETMKVILQMAVVLTFGASKNVVKIGRIAGQYAKPRSSDTETINGVEIPSYRGDCVNSPEATLEARKPDPDRLLQAYFHSTATLNLLRAYVQGGYADLHKVHVWNKEFVANSPEGERYELIAEKIDSAISFMEACGINSSQVPQLQRTSIYTSHEALILPYEEALTRRDSLSGRWYDCSAHMIWIGDRTRQIDAAHIEYFRGINNPIGMKVGPTMDADELIRILDILNPNNEEGRINLISRFGHSKIRKMLPDLVKRVRDEGRNVLWSCDPMHGNTFTADSGFKTRDFGYITDEIKGFFDTHSELGTIPGGLHFELTGANVTEICGGAQKISDLDLSNNYQTNCDPRLNCQQSLELAYDIAEMLQKMNLEDEETCGELDAKAFSKQLKVAEIQLMRLQREIAVKKIPVFILIDGLSTSGKSSCISHLVQFFDPRFYQVASGLKEDQQISWLQPFWDADPAKGTLTFFDRSWYRIPFKKEVEKKGDGRAYFEEALEFEKKTPSQWRFSY